MNKTLFAKAIVIVLAVFAVISTKSTVLAYEAPEMATIKLGPGDVDKRAENLEKFLGKYNSPLKSNAKTFVAVADKYGIDYRLLPSISCMESTCGKFLIPGTYNPFGWGIYGSQYISFKDYDEAIETVAKGLNESYFSKGLDTPEKIAPVYTPPNHVNWLAGVTYFMKQVDNAGKGASEIAMKN